MISQMNQVQNAARLAMGDHRAAKLRVTAQSQHTSWRTRTLLIAGTLAAVVAAAIALPGAF